MNVHPDVWNPAYRARFNQHMHAMLATRYARFSLAAGVIAALAASTALAGSLTTWDESLRHVASMIGQTLTALAAISAAIGPVLDWNGKHALHQELHAGYRTLEWRCRRGLVDSEAAMAELDHLEQREDAARPVGFDRLRAVAEAVTKRELGLS